MLEPELQAYASGEPFYFGSVVGGIETPEAAQPYVPASPEERGALSSLDWQAIAPLRGETVETFDRMFAG